MDRNHEHEEPFGFDGRSLEEQLASLDRMNTGQRDPATQPGQSSSNGAYQPEESRGPRGDPHARERFRYTDGAGPEPSYPPPYGHDAGPYPPASQHPPAADAPSPQHDWSQYTPHQRGEDPPSAELREDSWPGQRASQPQEWSPEEGTEYPSPPEPSPEEGTEHPWSQDPSAPDESRGRTAILHSWPYETGDFARPQNGTPAATESAPPAWPDGRPPGGEGRQSQRSPGTTPWREGEGPPAAPPDDGPWRGGQPHAYAPETYGDVGTAPYADAGAPSYGEAGPAPYDQAGPGPYDQAGPPPHEETTPYDDAGTGESAAPHGQATAHSWAPEHPHPWSPDHSRPWAPDEAHPWAPDNRRAWPQDHPQPWSGDPAWGQQPQWSDAYDGPASPWPAAAPYGPQAPPAGYDRGDPEMYQAAPPDAYQAAPPDAYPGASPAYPGAPPADTGPQEPQTADSLRPEALLHGRKRPPSSGWRRAVYRASAGLVHPGESPAELRRRRLVARARTVVAGGHHRVAVLSLKGGVGKTTTTIGLGSTLAALRGDRVVAIDANPDRGTLSDKLHLETAATVRDLLNERDNIRRYADVRAFTSQAPSRLEVLASDRDPAVSEAFSEDDYRAVARVLEHFYSICITDCGTGLLHSAMSGVLRLANQVVLVSSPSVDGARSASATLDWLEAHEFGDLVRAATVVLSGVRDTGKSSVDLSRLEQHFASRCNAVIRIPHDPHLEEGAEVELDRLKPATRETYLSLAAIVGDGLGHRRGAPVSPPTGEGYLR